MACALLISVLSSCGGSVPPATRQERARVDIVLYTTRWCPVCARARAWLRRRGIPFADRDVESSASAAAIHRRLNSSRTVPTIDVEGHILVGFDAEVLRQAIDRAAHRHAER